MPQATMNDKVLLSVALAAVLASCARDSPSELHLGAGTVAATAVRAEDWEVPHAPLDGATPEEVDPASFGWVPEPHQVEAILALTEEGCVRLSADDAVRFGASALVSDAGQDTFPVLLRGVRVSPDEGPAPYAGDRLSLEWVGSSLRVLHSATRPFPFDEKQARAVVALLTRMPANVAPLTSIAFTGGVR